MVRAALRASNDPAPPLAIDPGSLDQSTRIPSRRLCTFHWILGGGSTRARGWQTTERKRRRWRRDRFTCCFDVNTDISKYNWMMPSQVSNRSLQRPQRGKLITQSTRRSCLEEVMSTNFYNILKFVKYQKS